MIDDCELDKFLHQCEEITKDIINLYDELFKLELNGNLGSDVYKEKLLELKYMIENERNLYVSLYESLDYNGWETLESKAIKRFFSEKRGEENSMWFLVSDAIFGDMSYKLYKRIFKNIYTNIYEYLDKLENENCDEFEEEYEDEYDNDLEKYDIDDEVVDLTICDEIEKDYYNTFLYFLKKYLAKNNGKISKETFYKLIRIRYDMAFSDVEYEDEFFNNSFNWPGEIFLTVHMNSFSKAHTRAFESKNNNKTKLFLKYFNQYEDIIKKSHVSNLEEHIKKIIDSKDHNEYTEIVNFLYLKSIICALSYQSDSLAMEKLNEYSGKKEIFDKYISELLNYDFSNDKVYKLSLNNNKR